MSPQFKITRRVRLFFETVLVLVMLMAGALGWGVWQLSQGPIDLKPVTPVIARAFNSWLPGITFTVQDASLEWGGQQSPLILRVSQVDMRSERGREIGNVAEMRLGLAAKALLFGHIAPTSLDIAAPSLTITRFPDGHIGLRFNRGDETKDTADSSLTSDEILKLLQADHYSFMTYLERIMISDITISYRDFITQQNSIAKDGKLIIERSSENTLTGQGLINIPVGDELRPLTIDVHPETDTDKNQDLSIATIRLPALSSIDLQAFLPQQPWLTHFIGTLNSEINIAFDADMQTRFIEFAGNVDQGQVLLPEHFEEMLPIKTAQFGVRYDLVKDMVSLRDTHIVLPDTSISVFGQIAEPFNEAVPLKIKMRAQLDKLPIDTLHLYWPIDMAQSARRWVTKHIKVGTADKATASVVLTAPPDTLQNGQMDQLKLDALDGTIAFTNLTTDYLPPMIPVDHINGTIVYDQHNFTISPTSGQMRDTLVKGGTIKIAPLQAHDTKLDLALSLEGPLKDALVLLADKPLEFTQRVGIDPNLVSGRAETALHLEFPLENDLQLDQLSVKATSVLHDVTVRKAYRDAVLHGNTMNLAVSNDGLTLTGKANLSDAALESLNWDEYFGRDPVTRRQFLIKGRVTPQLLSDLRLDAGEYFKNYAVIDTKIVEDKNRETTIDLKADLTNAIIAIPQLRTEKPAGQNSAMSMTITASAARGATIRNLDVTSPMLAMKNATLTFDSSNQPQSITIPQLTAGETRAAITAKALARNKGWDASIKGASLDASGFWSGDKDEADAPNTVQPPIKLDIAVRKLMLDRDYPLTNVVGKFFVDNDIILQADADATANNSTPIRLRFGPTNKGNRILEMSTPNAGDALRALNISDSVRGGKLTITGRSEGATPQQIRGQMTLDNFSMVKAPLLARMLNAFSFGGLLDLLNQSGLSFSRMEAGFTRQDGQIILKQGKMAGASLGLNFAGTIDQKTNTLDIGGTIVPVQGINKLVSAIPLVGQILTGLKGEGLVAATYRITGSTKEPKVSVNPLSVLTPGILRSIFFEKND